MSMKKNPNNEVKVKKLKKLLILYFYNFFSIGKKFLLF